ncbi:MAG: hypothetical protein IPL61_03015 [Myxococcales bacterium]|nr:hypothetical protein [Myxococcales bacterium]
MTRSRWAAVLLVLGGCGGGESPAHDASAADSAELDAPTDAAIDGPTPVVPTGTNPGFPTPTAITRANQQGPGGWTELGDADWSCLETASTDLPPAGSIALTGTITDFQTGSGVGAAQVTAFPMLTPATSLGAATSSDVASTRGDFAMTVAPLPAGVRRYGFVMEATGYVRSYVVGRYLVPGTAQAIELSPLSQGTANALPAFLGVTRDPSTATALGTMVDCQGHRVSNAVATVSTGSAHAPGVDTYYFSAGSSSLPVRHSQAPVMNKDGVFMVLGVPPLAAAYVQVWGFRTAAELASGTLTLLADAPMIAEAGTYTSVDLTPRRAP